MWSLSNGRPPALSTARGLTGAASINFASRPAKSPRSGSTATPRRCAHFAPARRWSRSPDSSWRADLSGDGLRSDQAVDFVEVAGDAHAQLFHLGRWRQQVRHHDGHHPGAGRGPHAVIGILQGNAAFRLDAEPLGRFQKRLRMRFATGIIATRDNRLESVAQALRAEVTLHVLVSRGGG